MEDRRGDRGGCSTAAMRGRGVGAVNRTEEFMGFARGARDLCHRHHPVGGNMRLIRVPGSTTSTLNALLARPTLEGVRDFLDGLKRRSRGSPQALENYRLTARWLHKVLRTHKARAAEALASGSPVVDNAPPWRISRDTASLESVWGIWTKLQASVVQMFARPPTPIHMTSTITVEVDPSTLALDRAHRMEAIAAQLQDLGSAMRAFMTLLDAQGEHIRRIDTVVDVSMSNTAAAQAQLRVHWKRVKRAGTAGRDCLLGLACSPFGLCGF